MGGLGGVIKSIVDVVAPIASMIPGVGILAMAAKAAVDIGAGLMSSMDKSKDQDREDKATNAKQAANLASGVKDLAGAGGLLSSLGGGAAGGGMSAMLGGVGSLLSSIF